MDRAYILTMKFFDETEKALNSRPRQVEPNLNLKNHIVKIVAHAGNSSKNGVGVLKGVISGMLKEMKINMKDYYKDEKNGVYLVRFTAECETKLDAKHLFAIRRWDEVKNPAQGLLPLW